MKSKPFTMITFRMSSQVIATILLVGLLAFPNLPFSAEDPDVEEEAIAQHSRALIFGTTTEFQAALQTLTSRGDPDVAAAMILALRYTRESKQKVTAALQFLTRHTATSWFDWMIWQQTHPEIQPHITYTGLKLEVLTQIDEDFLQFFQENWADPKLMNIRMEEITWGGVPVDGIPSLDHPNMVSTADVDYLLDDDLVFGVAINGDIRAYPLRIMGWHEMFNDVVGGVPIALAYCTLCGSGILFETQLEGKEHPFVFGSSGMLYRSNKLMFDRQTNSLWNQFTGQPVVGPLVNSGTQLKIRPVTITSWTEWRTRHPATRVLSLETGFTRNYGSGVVYREYFESQDLMFPVKVNEEHLQQKDYIFGVRDVGAAKAWPIEAFKGGAVINDAVGMRNLVLIGDAATRTVRAYDRQEQVFQKTVSPNKLQGKDGIWSIHEEALIGPNGNPLLRVPGHISYWFAWDGYLGAKSELYTGSK